MMNQNAEDWLPPGWIVKVKMRKNGKKDKYYIESSSQMRFNSRAEMFRYLKTAGICHPESQERRTDKQPGKNVEVQRTLANGLPPGWIKEVRETRTPNRIRRDSFYIDPVSGKALRSIRDVHRYLITGKVGRLGYKTKNQKDSDVEFQHDDISSPAVPKKEMQTIGKARRQIIWSKNSSEPSEITNEEAIFPNAIIVGESMPLSEHNSSHGEIGTEVHFSTLLEPKDLKQSDEETDFSGLVSTPDKSTQHKCAIEDGPTKNESRKRQRKTKEDVSLPRRASKRLAGLQAEPVLEVKTSRRARLGACEESDKQVANKSASQCSENTDVKHETKSIIDKSPDSSRKENSCVGLPKHVKKQDFPEKRVSEIESGDKADARQGSLLKLPVEDFLTDPCIAFAVKTLTGGVFEASISSEASLMPSNMDHPSAAFTPNEMRNLKPENKLNEKLPFPELPISQPEKVENFNTSELPVGEILADPCIEFAIKTLTGEIPLDISPDIEDYFHQLSSSKTQGSSANASNCIGSDYMYEGNVLSQKPQVIQALKASSNINFQSRGTGLHQQEKN